ncbi:T9SS type A sorting domain-containing protein [Vicingus serpentipes]|uniref:T9SS type A sorting domain-containing protein n=1 Tax=Vicingus serpentipes TaxID=1926625 RepID=A0A5C6RXI1_9FLAO|nr:T9SS type A sorting domain-containing protein [Vicingus serpentipes]TXB66873.1 T9SS type A sorting domain-containing protein [Vicingus serpentipes]
MKKTLLSLFVIGTTFSAFAQTNNQLQSIDKTFKFDKYESKISTTAKGTVTCDNDTIDYSYAKATGLAALNLNNATSARAVSQYYNAPQSITVYGATFYAYKVDATGGISTNVNVEIYLAGADSMPTGAPLAAVSVPVDTSFGGGALAVLEKTVNFTSPVVVNQPYVIVVDNNSANGVGIVSNSYQAADGAQEWLSSANLFGTWTRSYALSLGGTLYDADIYIQPYVSYDVTVDFTVDGCLPTTGGGNISVTNTSSPILNDRMYSLAAFLGNTDTSYVYNFGEDATLIYQENPNHTYATSGTYTVTLLAGLQGWRSVALCSESQTGTADICTGINENSNTTVQLYPNPVNNLLNINGLEVNSSINIFDLTGKLVISKNNLSNTNFSISTESLKAGVYFVSINNENTPTKTVKIIKQ